MTTISISVGGQYATCSRGRICAKHISSGVWGDKSGGTVTLDRAGKWMVSQTDGFSRKETVYVEVSEDGTITGLGRRMWIA